MGVCGWAGLTTSPHPGRRAVPSTPLFCTVPGHHVCPALRLCTSVRLFLFWCACKLNAAPDHAAAVSQKWRQRVEVSQQPPLTSSG